MPLGPNMIYSTVQIIGDWDSPEPPYSTYRGAIGTGFLVAVISEVPRTAYVYVVTAAHVVQDQRRVQVQAIAEDGKPMPLQDMTHWWYHPNRLIDVAVAPFREAVGFGSKPLVLNLEQQTATENLPLGSTVHYIGLLDPLKIPMVRSGTLGALNQSGLRFKGGWDFTAHLIDCRSFGGFSGSPVYVENFYPRLKQIDPIPFPVDPDEPPTGWMLFIHLLCGMFTAHFDQPGMFEQPDGTLTEISSRHGVGIVLPVRYIREVVYGAEMTEARRENDTAIRELPEGQGGSAAPGGAWVDDL